MMSVRVRFAPSPTGRIHVGNIRAALVNWLFAKQQGGTFILRIDDTDRARSTKDYEDGIREDLAWLGLDYQETFNQSDRFDRYDAVVADLKERGLLYAAYETAEELEVKRKIQLGRGLPPVYDRAALKLTDAEKAAYETEGRTPHWRFKLDQSRTIEFTDMIRGAVKIDLSSVSDPVLIRADGTYLYTLPSVVDDHDYGITHIVRGEDHVTNSAVQVAIFEALGGKAPEMAHFALLTGAKGEGLSKRHGAQSIQDYREEGVIESRAIIAMLARLGTSDPIVPVTAISDLLEDFDFGKFSRGAAKFDPEELKLLSAKILHISDYSQVESRLPDGMTAAVWDQIKANIDQLSDCVDWWRIINGPVEPIIEDADYLAKAAELLPGGEYDGDTWGQWTNAIKEATGAKGKALFMPLRLALTGVQRGPEMAVLLPLIGRDEAAARLTSA